MSEVFKFIGLDPKIYNGHSVKIEAATPAAKVGFSENAIQNMCKWKSDLSSVSFVYVHFLLKMIENS